MPISPVARRCLFLAYESKITLQELEKQFTDIYFKLNQAQKGFYIEKLLITLISLRILKKVTVHSICPGGGELANTHLFFNSFSTINFGGYFAPPKQIDDSLFGGNLLFVPTACNYPDFDFCFYTPKTALFFQTTIMANCHEHVASNDKKANSGFEEAGTLSATMKVILIDFNVLN